MSGSARFAILAVLIVLAGCTPTGAPSTSSGRSADPSMAQQSQRPAAGFPTQVGGLPVITVARALDLLQGGKLDGRAVAVSGYYNEFDPSCPYPGRYIGPLESWCRLVAFTDAAADAQICEPFGSNGTSCHGPAGMHLEPFFVSETGGDPWSRAGAGSGDPAALVLIGHAGDARRLQCLSATADACAAAFVVDRVAWADGEDVPLVAAETGDQQSGAPISPRLRLDQVAAAAGVGNSVLAAGAFRVGDIATVDPRWNLAGDKIVWFLRSAGPAGESGDEARTETVWLVDDTTGSVLTSQPATVDAAYHAAKLFRTATVHGLDCCTGDVTALDRIEAADGTVAYEGLLSGSETGTQDTTTFGGTYGSQLLVLPPGRYTVATWLATDDKGVAGTPYDACTTSIELAPAQLALLDADFPAGQACTARPAPVPTPGY